MSVPLCLHVRLLVTAARCFLFFSLFFLFFFSSLGTGAVKDGLGLGLGELMKWRLTERRKRRGSALTTWLLRQ